MDHNPVTPFLLSVPPSFFMFFQLFLYFFVALVLSFFIFLVCDLIVLSFHLCVNRFCSLFPPSLSIPLDTRGSKLCSRNVSNPRSKQADCNNSLHLAPRLKWLDGWATTQVAYFWTHSRAVWSCFALSFRYNWAISGTSGSFGFGSVSSDEMDSNTFEMVSAGLH